MDLSGLYCLLTTALNLSFGEEHAFVLVVGAWPLAETMTKKTRSPPLSPLTIQLYLMQQRTVNDGAACDALGVRLLSRCYERGEEEHRGKRMGDGLERHIFSQGLLKQNLA